MTQITFIDVNGGELTSIGLYISGIARVGTISMPVTGERATSSRPLGKYYPHLVNLLRRGGDIYKKKKRMRTGSIAIDFTEIIRGGVTNNLYFRKNRRRRNNKSRRRPTRFNSQKQPDKNKLQ